ncbi:MAG: phosphodiester glycosidase family protein, partial [Phycisphaerae bacterium]|nr:phosphodiester glycosidase family protein [Phycisphaerae bacterium]
MSRNVRKNPIWLGAVCLCLILAMPAWAQVNSSVPLPIPPGLDYMHSRIGAGPLSIHVLKIDRSNPQFRFTTSLARNTVLGLEPLSEQVRALDPSGRTPVAAVNGDFFVIRPGPYQGDPLGLQILRGELVSSPGSTCFWLDQARQPHIAKVRADFLAAWPDGVSISFDINQELAQDRAVLYTPTMGHCTRTNQALELVLEPESPWLPLKPGQTYRARIVSVTQDPNSVIPSDKMVLALSPEVAGRIPAVTPGTMLSLSLKTHPDLTGVDTAIGGRPLLVVNGMKETFGPNQPRHPRTAIGWNARHYFLVVVDGRQEGLSVGMSLPELADLMVELKCTDAMNLDGGGSSTLWLAGHIMNSPSDRQERRIANGLILL